MGCKKTDGSGGLRKKLGGSKRSVRMAVEDGSDGLSGPFDTKPVFIPFLIDPYYPFFCPFDL